MFDDEEALDAIDPAVAAAMAESDKRQKRREMTPAERRKADRDAERDRATYDLTLGLIEAVKKVAEEEEMTASGTVALLLAQAVNRYRSGLWTLNGAKTSTRSPLYRWIADGGTVNDVLNGERDLANPS